MVLCVCNIFTAHKAQSCLSASCIKRNVVGLIPAWMHKYSMAYPLALLLEEEEEDPEFKSVDG